MEDDVIANLVSKLLGHYTGANILSEFEKVVSCTAISSKVYKVVTDNASNVQKAFSGSSGSIPGFEIEQDSCIVRNSITTLFSKQIVPIYISILIKTH